MNDEEIAFRRWALCEEAECRLNAMKKLKQDPAYSKLTKKMKGMLRDLEAELCDRARGKFRKPTTFN